MVRHVDGTVLGTVVTRVDAAAEAVATAEDVGEPLLGSVPDAPDVAGDEPLVRTAPGSDAAAAYEGLVPEIESELAASRREAVAADPGPTRVTSPTQD
jgi:hypothetical protein